MSTRRLRRSLSRYANASRRWNKRTGGSIYRSRVWGLMNDRRRGQAGRADATDPAASRGPRRLEAAGRQAGGAREGVGEHGHRDGAGRGCGAEREAKVILVRVVAPHFVAGFETDGIVRRAAPILRRLEGLSDDAARVVIDRAGWRASVVSDDPY